MSIEQAVPNPYRDLGENQVQRQKITIENSIIEVASRKFVPSFTRAEHIPEYIPNTFHRFPHLFSDTVSANNRAILLMPGFPTGADNETTRPLVQYFANFSDTQTFMVSTIAANPDPAREARALLEFVRANGLQEVIVAGHSRGARVMQEFTLLVQHDAPEVIVRGLIQLNPAGYFEQTVTRLAGASIRTNIREMKKRKQAAESGDMSREIIDSIGANDVSHGIRDRVRLHGEEKLLSKRTRTDALHELEQITDENTHLDDIAVPTIILAGKDDLLFPPQRILGTNAKNLDFVDRTNYLQTRFPKMHNRVRMLVATREGSHAGTNVYRPRRTALAVLAQLERMYR